MTHGERARLRILETGVALWGDGKPVTARAIARELGRAHQGVLYHWDGAAGLLAAVAAHAVEVGDVRVIPMLIANRHPAVDGMPDDVRAGWLNRSIYSA